MSSREDILRELELLPAWRLRAPLPTVNALTENKPLQVQQVTAEYAASIKSAQLEPAVVPVEAEIELHPNSVSMTPTAPSPTIGLTSPLLNNASTATERGVQVWDWKALQDHVLTCNACRLAALNTPTIFGMGDTNAEWLFVGDIADLEDQRPKEPFANDAGQLLDNMLAAIQLRRGNNVFMANTFIPNIKASSTSQAEQSLHCDADLKPQQLKPKLIVALGEFAAQSLLQSEDSMASLRGKLHQYHDIPLIVTYHPEDLLRTPLDKRKAWEDLCLAKQTMQNL